MKLTSWLLIIGAALTAVIAGVAALSPTYAVVGLAGVIVAIAAVLRPFRVACLFGFLAAAFPKAGFKIDGFPFPVFLFGLVVAVALLFVTQPKRRPRTAVLVVVGVWLTFVGARTVLLLDEGAGSVFAFVAWAALPIVLLTMTTALVSVPPQWLRSFQWGFLVSAAYAVVQLVGGVTQTAISGVTFAAGDDLADKHNTIYVTGGVDFSKIPSTYQNGNIYGIVAAVFLVFTLVRLLRRRGTKLDVLVVLAAVMAIGLSGSRTAIIAAGLPILVLLLRKGSLRWRAGIVTIAVVAVMAVFTLRPGLAQRYTLDSIVSSGGSGRTRIWAEYLAQMRPGDFVFGMPDILGIPDGWVGVVIQIGYVGSVLLAVAVFALSRARPEWNLVLLVLLIGALIDSTYITFPTWFLPAALFAARLDDDNSTLATAPVRSPSALART